MESVNSFKGYGKVQHELEEQAYRKKTRKRLIIITLSTIVLMVIAITVLPGVFLPEKSIKSSEKAPISYSGSAGIIKEMCDVTRYPDSCASSVASLAGSSNSSSNLKPEEVLVLSMQVAINELTKLLSLPGKLISSEAYGNETSNSLVRGAVYNCESLIKDAIDHVNESISSMQGRKGEKAKMVVTVSEINDIKTWLSTAITDQETCLDGLVEAASHTTLLQNVRFAMSNSTEFTSNSLAIASNIMATIHGLQTPVHRRLLGINNNYHHHDFVGGFPAWVHSRDKRLLQEETPIRNLTVAKDGSGNFRTISEAVDSIPKMNNSRFVIYVKEGLYVENVNVDTDYWNVMMYGDGMYKTIISGSLNMADGIPTYSSGTFSK